MTNLRKSLIALGVLFGTASFTPVKVLCHGFLPENTMQIPVHVMQVGGISQADFNDVLDQLEKYYTPIVSSRGGNYSINRLWDDPTVNASAQQNGSQWVLNMYGGLARHPQMNKDTFMLVGCHETGHHLGGAPKINDWFGGNWASNEGEADYYANLDCTRFMFNDNDNQEFVKTQTIDPALRTKCLAVYTSQPEQNLCIRAGMAGFNAALLFKAMRKENTNPGFTTPDPAVVAQMDDSHPATQCRLDTYYQGAVCFHDLKIAPSDTDVAVGACTESAGQHDGNRPRCWFAP